jgi:YspA, cpYpsA-related SLOG family
MDNNITVLVSGTREGCDEKILIDMISEIIKTHGSKNYTLICGGAKGVDMQAANYCLSLGWKVKYFIPKWTELGRKAGVLRNQDMINQTPDFGFFIPSTESKGTYDCLERFKKINKPGLVYNPYTNSIINI